jgi:hypothetical protein
VELWELTARESIRDLVVRYNSNGDSGRFAEVYTLFAPDATMEIAPGMTTSGIYRGLDEIATIFTGARDTLKGGAPQAKPTYMRHYTATHQVDLIDAQHAKGRCYYQVLMPHALDHWGRYIDEYEQRDGRWVFVYRKVTMDGWVPGGMAEATVAPA